MTGQGKLDNLIKKSGGVITSKLADANGIHREYLSEYARQGKLISARHGVYITQDVWEDKMYILQLRKTRLIYSHETALFIHDLTDRDPLQYCVTVPRGYNTKKLNQDGFAVHTIKKEFFDLGLCTRKTQYENDVRVYDMERTICDILRDRNNQDPAIVSEALKRYTKRKDKDINKLMKYAEKLRVEKVLRQYLEVLL